MKLKRSHTSLPKVNIGFVGFGRRVQEVYLPIISKLDQRYQLVGVTTQSAQHSNDLADKKDISVFSSAAELVKTAKPDFLVVAVASHANETTLLDLLNLKVPLLSETPLAWSITKGKEIVDKAIRNNVLLAVAEQKPFLPIEQLRKVLVDSGVFGQIYAAYNDFHTYSYHGIARLRRYFKGNPKQVFSHTHDFEAIGASTNIVGNKYSNQWKFGTVFFDDNSIMLHQYSDYYVTSDACFPKAIRLYGTAGSMVNDEIRSFNSKLGHIETVRVKRHEKDDGTLTSLSVTFSGSETVVWQNDYSEYSLTDEEIAVLTLLDGMTESVLKGEQLLYSGSEFLKDIEIMKALSFSEQRSNVKINLPLNEPLQKILAVTHLPFHQKKRH